MEGLIDLHTHTTASDGSYSPRELVRHAKKNGLKALAITDHDTIDGAREALDEGRILGMEVIPGVEISVDFKPEMHILGYFTSETYTNFVGIMDELKQNRDERNPKIVSKLNELGFAMTMAEVEAKAAGDIVGRPHIASVMLEKGYVKSVRDAFDKYLADGRPAFFKKDKLNPGEGIKEIISAGGVAVLAHPVLLNFELEKLDKLIGELASQGLQGIEAHYVENSREDTGVLLRLAIKHNIIVTGGSDFHGTFKDDIQIGVGRGNLKVPDEVLIRLNNLLKTKTPS